MSHPVLEEVALSKDFSFRYRAMVEAFFMALMVREPAFKTITWVGTHFPWDVFTKANPEAKELAERFEAMLGYELSERQCSIAVVSYCEAQKEKKCP